MSRPSLFEIDEAAFADLVAGEHDLVFDQDDGADPLDELSRRIAAQFVEVFSQVVDELSEGDGVHQVVDRLWAAVRAVGDLIDRVGGVAALETLRTLPALLQRATEPTFVQELEAWTRDVRAAIPNDP